MLHQLAEHMARLDRLNGPIDAAFVRAVEQLMPYIVDRVMGEGLLYAPELAALALAQTGKLVFDMGTLSSAVDQTIVLTFTVTAPAAGGDALTNAAAIGTSTTPEPIKANNSASVTTTAIEAPPIDLVLALLVSEFSFACSAHFVHHPLAAETFRREHDDEIVVEANSFINLFVELVTAFQVFVREPYTQVVITHPGVQPLCELLIFSGIADEAGVELFIALFGLIRA